MSDKTLGKYWKHDQSDEVLHQHGRRRRRKKVVLSYYFLPLLSVIFFFFVKGCWWIWTSFITIRSVNKLIFLFFSKNNLPLLPKMLVRVLYLWSSHTHRFWIREKRGRIFHKNLNPHSIQPIWDKMTSNCIFLFSKANLLSLSG